MTLASPAPQPSSRIGELPPRLDTQRESTDVIALTKRGTAVTWLKMLGGLFIAWVGIHTLMEGFANLNAERAAALLSSPEAPLIAFIAGLLATVIVQSSGTVSVLLVAAIFHDTISLPFAIAAVLGANLGTVLTPLILSLLAFWRREQRELALRASFLHVFFNLIGVAIVLPIEIIARPLYLLVENFSSPVNTLDSTESFLILPIYHPLQTFEHTNAWANVALIAVGLCLSTLGLHIIRLHAWALLRGTGYGILERTNSVADFAGLIAGMALTMLVGASSITVAGVASISAAHAIRTRAMISIILGANIGTTLLGIIATFGLHGATASLAFQFALVHFLFNLVGTLVVLLCQPARKLLVTMADRAAEAMDRHLLAGISLIVMAWGVVPSLILTLF